MTQEEKNAKKKKKRDLRLSKIQQKKKQREKFFRIGKVKKSIVSGMEVIGYDFDNNLIRVRSGYMYPLQISFFDTESASDSELLRKTLAYDMYIRLLENQSVKFMSIDYPMSFKENIQYYQHLDEINDSLNWMQEESIQQFEFLETEHTKEDFLWVFGKSIDDTKRAVQKAIKYLSRYVAVFDIDFDKTVRLLFKMHNQNSEFRHCNVPAYNRCSQLEFIESIMPRRGVQYDNIMHPFITKRDGFEAVVTIDQYPNDVELSWLDPIKNLSDVIMTQDFMPEKRSKSISDLDSNIQEQISRLYDDRGTAVFAARDTLEQIQEVYNAIAKFGSVLTATVIRLYVHAKTQKELDEKLQLIQNELSEGNSMFEVSQQHFVNQEESTALFKPLGYQLFNKKFKPYLSWIRSDTIALSLPFKHQILTDKRGIFLGTTATDGVAIFDQWYKDNKKRLSYDILITGKKGSGKSTTVKKLIKNNFLRGIKQFGFDVEGEYKKIVDRLGGKYLYADGRDGILNPLHVRLSGFQEITETYEFTDDQIDKMENITEVNYAVEFQNHLTFLGTFMKSLFPNLEEREVTLLRRLFRETYSKKGIDINTDFSKLKSVDYPTFSDVYTEYVSLRESDNWLNDYESFKNLRIDLSELTHIENGSYALYFDGHTPFDLSDEKLVFFNMQSILENSEELFQATFLNYTSYFWSLFVAQRELNASREIKQYLAMLWDEAQTIVNLQNIKAIRFVNNIVRRARKYLAGIVLVSQSLRDWMPEGASEAIMNVIKSIFENIQYFIIMQQHENALSYVSKIFNTINESQVLQLANFDMGEALLLTGEQILHLSVFATHNEIDLFDGGI